MKKIMFDDKYGLTEAVLTGRKTMTRRIISESALSRFGHNKHSDKSDELIRFEAAYKVGEIVAVAQNLKDMGYNPGDMADGHIWGLDHTAAWKNKMFVCAKQCKHQIKITAVKVERLQDISDEDCVKEGIIKYKGVVFGCFYKPDGEAYTNPQRAFMELIDKVSGKGTWQRNPWVFAYEFELVK